jgi:2-oxo-4-hydroxy-4-carboxy-5-ureidoimidazoline decarboxylase
VFEHSPWIAERVFAARPFASIDALHAAMVDVVQRASREEQLALLRAHPDLAGKEAKAGSMTLASTHEQSTAGLSALSQAELARIAALNRSHQERFGFPFIIAARKHGKAEIFAEFERRLAIDVESERLTCLDQVFVITRLRLEDLVVA